MMISSIFFQAKAKKAPADDEAAPAPDAVDAPAEKPKKVRNNVR